MENVKNLVIALLSFFLVIFVVFKYMSGEPEKPQPKQVQQVRQVQQPVPKQVETPKLSCSNPVITQAVIHQIFLHYHDIGIEEQLSDETEDWGVLRYITTSFSESNSCTCKASIVIRNGMRERIVHYEVFMADNGTPMLQWYFL